MLRAAIMLLAHIGYDEKSELLEHVLDFCLFSEKKVAVTGRESGCTCSEFGDYVMETVSRLTH